MKTNYIEHGLLKTCLKTIETFFFHASFQQCMAERYETETTMTCSEHVFSSCHQTEEAGHGIPTNKNAVGPWPTLKVTSRQWLDYHDRQSNPEWPNHSPPQLCPAPNLLIDRDGFGFRLETGRHKQTICRRWFCYSFVFFCLLCRLI